MQLTWDHSLGPEMTREFEEQIEAFRRHYLLRVLSLLAASAWAVGMVVLFFHRRTQPFAVLVGFEAVCWLCYRLCLRNRLRWAQHLLVIGVNLWLLGLIWLVPQPLMLFLPIIGAPIAIAVVDTTPAVIYTLLLAFGQVLGASRLASADLLSWQAMLAPLATLEAAALAMIWRANFDGVVGWAVHSTRSAIERLEETQEHRAQLHRSMERLDAANKRLERVNDMLRTARAEAEAANQARNQFALTVSHELRTPLNFIIGFSEMMINSPEIYADLSQWPPGLYDDVRDIHHSSNHLLRLVNDILDLGQAEARRLILAKEWVAPAAIVQETESIMRAAAMAQQLYLNVEVEPGLPDLFVDLTRIRQVLINLIGNSLRFTEEGGITVSVRRRATDVLFCVADTGVGIPADEVSKVFEDFGQANTTVWRRRGGSGLGVPISRRFVRMHGGQMWLESELDKGTTFYFTLPMSGAARDVGDLAFLQDDSAGRAAAGPLDKVILVVSPDPGADRYIEQCVEGYRVVATGQADLARRHLATLLPHALIIDQGMAAEREIVALVETLPYDLPVIVFDLPGSGPSRSELPEGVRGHLLKPVQREDLVAVLGGLGREVRSVLLVDDDPRMERFVRLALSASPATRAGETVPIQVLASQTGRAALERVLSSLVDGEGSGEQPQPDAILLDLDLPDMSGWEVLAELQANPQASAIPVVLVTAMDLRQEISREGRQLLQVSRKRPLTFEELEATLQVLLEHLRPLQPTGAVPAEH